MNGKVHQAKMPGFVRPLLAVDRNLDAGIALVSLDEIGTSSYAVHFIWWESMICQVFQQR